MMDHDPHTSRRDSKRTDSNRTPSSQRHHTHDPIAIAVPLQEHAASRIGSLFSSIVDHFKHRPFRVVVLISMIIAMSLVDLYLTILYITHSGMNEVNPVARAMMEYQSPMILAIWKLTTVSIGTGILFLIRNKRTAELGAWAGMLILSFLMTHWVSFIDEHAKITDPEVIAGAFDDPSWIYIESDMLGPNSIIP